MMETSISQSVVFNGHLLLKEQADLLAVATPSDINYLEFLRIKRNAQQRRTAQLNFLQRLMSERDTKQHQLNELFDQKVEKKISEELLNNWNNLLELDKVNNPVLSLSSTSNFALPATLNDNSRYETNAKQSPVAATNVQATTGSSNIIHQSSNKVADEIHSHKNNNDGNANHSGVNYTQLQYSFDVNDSLCYGRISRDITNEVDLSLQSKHIAETDSVASAHNNNNNRDEMYNNNHNNDNDNIRDVNVMQSTTLQSFPFKANTASNTNTNGCYVQQQNMQTTYVHAHDDGYCGYEEQAKKDDESSASKAAAAVTTATHEHFKQPRLSSSSMLCQTHDENTDTKECSLTMQFASAISNNNNSEYTNVQEKKVNTVQKRESFDEKPAVALGKAKMYHDSISISNSVNTEMLPPKKLWRADELVYNDEVINSSTHTSHVNVQNEVHKQIHSSSAINGVAGCLLTNSTQQKVEEHEDEQEEVKEITLLPCPSCGRTFAPERLARHQIACEKQREMESRRRAANKLNKTYNQLPINNNSNSNSITGVISSRKRHSNSSMQDQREAMSSVSTSAISRSRNNKNNNSNYNSNNHSRINISGYSASLENSHSSFAPTHVELSANRPESNKDVINAHHDSVQLRHSLELNRAETSQNSEESRSLTNSLRSSRARDVVSKNNRPSTKEDTMRMSMQSADEVGEDGRVLCIYCGRRFAPTVAERHIPFCETKHTRQ